MAENYSISVLKGREM